MIELMDKRKSKKTRMAVSSAASKKEYKQYAQKEEKGSHGKMAKVFMILVLVFVAGGFVCVSGVFDIAEIIVEENAYISDEQIISFSGLEKGTNLFAISKEETINKIKENPYVDKVQVRRCLPNKIKLTVKERNPEYALPLANSFVYVNREGYILEISNNQPQIPILLGAMTDLSNVKENQRLEENDLEKMKMVTKIMEMAKNHKMENLITKIDISDAENYAVYLEVEGKIAYLGNGTELNTRFLYIKAILKEQQGKTGKIFVNVDLNAENVYFREEQI